MQKEKNSKKRKTVKGNQVATTGSRSKVPSESAVNAKSQNDSHSCHKNSQDSNDVAKHGHELMKQFKETAEKLRTEIKSKLDEKCNQIDETMCPVALTTADDVSKVQELLHKAMIDEEEKDTISSEDGESAKCASKSTSSCKINVTSNESPEENSRRPSVSSCEFSSLATEANHNENTSSEKIAKVSEKEITHVQESPNCVPVTSLSPTVDEKPVKDRQQITSSSRGKVVPSKSKQMPSNAPSTLASILDRNKQRALTPKLTIEDVLSSVSSCESESEKMKKLAERLSQSTEHQRTLEIQLRNQEKMIAQLIKEKENLQSDHNRTLLARSRLENVCRELQRQNRSIKEEALSKIKEEEEKRRQVASKFQTTLNEVLSVVQENQARHDQLKVENVDLLNKLKAIMCHYELWEASVQKLIQQKELEVKLLTAKMVHNDELAAQERDRYSSEKEILFDKITNLQEKAILMDNTEAHLKEEISAYRSKYDEFQSILEKSNDTFTHFKKDMDKMSKQMKKLDRETLNWKSKFETCNRELLHVTQDNHAKEKELMIASGKIETLQKLCRALQARNNISVSSAHKCHEQATEHCNTCSTSHGQDAEKSKQ